MKFNAEKETAQIISFIKKFFETNSFAKGAVIGMSGGKDSLTVAALCVKALGKEKVLGVLMPNGKQTDIADSLAACRVLGIQHIELNISEQYNSCVKNLNKALNNGISKDALINIPPRIRTLSLYALAQSLQMLVSCNSNLSEKTVGYTTKWGDNAGDFAPIAHLTKSEVILIGNYLGLPKSLTEKPPSDGLTGKTDEEILGFTYDALDAYIREGKGEAEVVLKIEKRISQNKHKVLPIPTVK